VDKAESEPELAEKVNAEAPGRLAQSCAERGAVLIHLSTDYVFDGEKNRPYNESDPVNPISVYGRSKALGEARIREALDRHIILRTSWVFSSRGSNFVKTILRLSHEKSELKVVDDQIGGPTAAGDIARSIAAIARHIRDKDAGWGTFHYAGDDAVSWHGFAQAILEQSVRFGGRVIPVRPISTEEYPTLARRPANSALDCALIQQIFGIARPSWRHALSQVVAELQGG
jgi:dTDP-4-dehydrorhamnose reductase